MIPEFGHFALILALCLALTQASLPLYASFRNRVVLMKMARSITVGQFFFISIAFSCLAYAFLTNDFSVVYVAQNSNSHLPWIYRFCAVWGAHEGSLLLWVFILSIWMLAVALFSRHLELVVVTRVLAILAMISIGFLLFMLLTSNPFARLVTNIPQDGNDLNPLLQDPGLVSHPPMLYMGYVGFSVAFAFAIAALLGGRLDAQWARWSRPWAAIAWSFLTLGITLGSWWAYRQLGWGGWWFWDPVENASLMPWLAGTALLHSLIVTEKQGVFKAWTVLLSICTFSLSLVGTFLVRSGVLVSVHAFAIDPSRGAYLLKFLAIVIGGSLLLYAWRAGKIRSEGNFDLYSREAFLLGNNLLLFFLMLTILLGTLYPLFIDALGLGKLSVGAPYFNTVLIPLITPLFLLMGVGPFTRWHHTDGVLLAANLRYILLISVIFAIGLPWLVKRQVEPYVVLGLFLAFWIILTTLRQCQWKLLRNQYAMVVAHFGIAICIIGVTLTSAYSIQRDVRMSPDVAVNLGPYQFTFLGTRDINGSNYYGIEAGILVKKNNKVITLLKPQRRVYTVEQTANTKAAIDTNLFRDLYVALGEPIGKNSWSLRIYYKPFVRWIWCGGLLMLLGGLLAASNRRYYSEWRHVKK